MAHGDAREGKWRGNWWMKWVASTLHTTSEHGVSGVTTADAHTSAASNRLNWRPRQFKWTRPFRRKTKSGFCACAITFQTHCTPLKIDRCRILIKVTINLKAGRLTLIPQAHSRFHIDLRTSFTGSISSFSPRSVSSTRLLPFHSDVSIFRTGRTWYCDDY
jgi:hypothetical protein